MRLYWGPYGQNVLVWKGCHNCLVLKVADGATELVDVVYKHNHCIVGTAHLEEVAKLMLEWLAWLFITTPGWAAAVGPACLEVARVGW